MKIIKNIIIAFFILNIFLCVYAGEEEIGKAQILVNQASELEEKGLTDGAKRLYEEIIKKYPNIKGDLNFSFAEHAGRRLIWISGDRSWIFKDPKDVIPDFKNAILSKNMDLIKKYASKVNFGAGWCESEGYDFSFDDFKNKINKLYPQEEKIIVSEKLQEWNKQKVLKTSGWKAEKSNIYFTFSAIEGGWEWTGIVYCDE